MKKLLEFFKTHRVFTMLMAIVLVCVIIICTVLIQCFYVGNGSDKYGERLEGISNYEISDSRLSDYQNNTAANEKVKSAQIRLQGKIIYITLQMEEAATLEEAKSIALKSLESFSQEEMGFYDISVTMKKNSSANSDGFIISGYKNKKTATIVWNNNRPITATEANPNTTEKG